MKMPPEFGQDPMDQYSIPLDSETTILAILFQLNPREKPEKPGRSLVVEYDDRVPLVPYFETKYAYTVTFSKPGKQAGNHFHRQKAEIMRPVIGSVTVRLEDQKTKVREEHLLNATNHQAIYIRPEIAHVVISQSEPTVLLVMATHPNNEADEFPYQLS